MMLSVMAMKRVYLIVNIVHGENTIVSMLKMLVLSVLVSDLFMSYENDLICFCRYSYKSLSCEVS